jgi:hypothetical protein
MLNSLSSLSDDESDLVTSHDHLEETAASATAAATTSVSAHAWRSALRSVALVGNDVIDRGLRVTKKIKFCKPSFSD